MVEYGYLYPKKAAMMRQLHDSVGEYREHLNTTAVQNATVIPIRKIAGNMCFGVLSSDGIFLPESADSDKNQGYSTKAQIKSDQTVVYCGFFAMHWGHFLLDCCKRLWYACKDESVDAYVFSVYEGEAVTLQGNFKEFFDMLGITHKVRFVSKPTQYAKVLIPEPAYCLKKYYSDAFVALFDRVIAKALQSVPSNTHTEKKIFFSRSKFQKARDTEVGIDFLDHFFEKNGFKIISPESVSLSQTIYLLHHAEVAAMSSGTLPHNMLFAPNHSKTIIVERQANINTYQLIVDKIRNLDVTYIDGHFTIKPVWIGRGPFFYAYNRNFQAFTEKHNMLAPDDAYLSEKYLRKNLRTYMKTHWKFYHDTAGMEDWQIIYAELLFEAYLDTRNRLGKYLDGTHLFRMRQVFDIVYIKSFVKGLIHR